MPNGDYSSATGNQRNTGEQTKKANEKHRASEETAGLLAFHPQPPKENERLQRLRKKIPILGDLFLSTGDASYLTHVEGIHAPPEAFSGLPFAAMVMYAIDFLLLPLVYLAATIRGESLPISLSRAAKWLYSGALLGLVIAAIALPAIAVPLAMAMAAVTLSFSLYTMGKVLYENYQLSKKLKHIEAEISIEMSELNTLHKDIIHLEAQLDSEEDEEKKRSLSAQISHKLQAFKSLHAAKKELLQNLHNTQYSYQTQLRSQNALKILDRGVAISFAALSIIGLSLGLFFPPVGMAIFAASAILSSAYLIGRLSYALIKLIQKKFNKKEATLANEDSLEGIELMPLHAPLQHPQAEPAPTTVTTATEPATLSEVAVNDNSTVIAMKALFDQGHAHKKTSHQWKINIHETLLKMVQTHDTAGTLQFLKNAADYIKEKTGSTEDIRQFFAEVEDMPSVITVIRDALSAAQNGSLDFPEQDKKTLRECTPIKIFLQEHGVNLLEMLPPQPPEPPPEGDDDETRANASR
jgi:uncharacterized protein YaaW (UPF0174 family)